MLVFIQLCHARKTEWAQQSLKTSDILTSESPPLNLSLLGWSDRNGTDDVMVSDVFRSAGLIFVFLKLKSCVINLFFMKEVLKKNL